MKAIPTKNSAMLWLFGAHRLRVGFAATIALAGLACTEAAIKGGGTLGPIGTGGAAGTTFAGGGMGGLSIIITTPVFSTGGTTGPVCNATSTEGCVAVTPEGCGDGKNNQGGIEQCDDGNMVPGDGCNGVCKVERYWSCPKEGPCTRMIVCGDGQIDAGEVCDDNNALEGDGCSADCTVQDPAFKCQPGQPCVRISQCGNKRVEPGETCDDGNAFGEDGCSSACILESGFVCPIPGQPCKPAPRCGDSLIQTASGEVCDDGNQLDGDGCSADCKLKGTGCICTPGQACVCPVVECGNGVLENDEECDDGNTVAEDGCSATCQLEDGYECRMPGQTCLPKCGDSKKIGIESCDDGNAESGDGCSSTCQVEPGAGCPDVGKPCTKAECGNGRIENGELCDCGTDSANPSKADGQDCKGINGLFYGDAKGCSKTCTKEPTCQDAEGKTQACTTACGDGNIDPGEECDDGNGLDADGCSTKCTKEAGFFCANKTLQDSATCQAGSGQCLQLPIIYRDFQPENDAAGGHPDFAFLGTRFDGATKPTTICVPDTGGPSKGNDSTTRCWGILANNLLNGKPQPGATTTCACQFSDWSIGNASHVPSGYSRQTNESPLSDGNGNYQGSAPGDVVNTTSTAGAYRGNLTGYTNTSPGGPIWKGTAPAYKDAASLSQWWNDDPSVNETFTAILELPAIGSNIYQYASTSHLAEGGFFPLDALNPSQATLCNLWPYWNHPNGTPIWSTCRGDQYLFPPRIVQADCPGTTPLSGGCWVTNIPGVKHDSYFTDEARYYFVYDASAGVSLSFFGDDDLFIFINGILVLDLGGIHQQVPGKVTVSGDPGVAQITEGGCLDAAGNIIGVTAGSTACAPTNSSGVPAAASPADFRIRQVDLGLQSGQVYEIAIFGADRHPPESNYQLTLQGFTTKRTECTPICGDGIVAGGEECDCGDGSVDVPERCQDKNGSALYNGCTAECKYGPFCGDSQVTDGEECDNGKNHDDYGTLGGCAPGCKNPGNCGDGLIQSKYGEQCDDGEKNSSSIDKTAAYGLCMANCQRGGYCGDGQVNGTEQCDDGANDGTYGTCNPDCTLAPRCGDGVIQPEYGEECEPTSANDPTCTNACHPPGGCGDGKIQPPEQCDEGAQFNTGEYGGCAPGCVYAPYCGDGIKNGPEECDDGINDGSYGGCLPNCKLAPHCGDGLIQPPEECDDGKENGTNGRCSANCKTIIYTPP